MTGSILVLGAAGSVGRAVFNRADSMGMLVCGADAKPGDEELTLDCGNGNKVVQFFRSHGPFDNVIYAAGMNLQTLSKGMDWNMGTQRMMEANFYGPMYCLQSWLKQDHSSEVPRHFVVISSNSAHIARSKSSGYCASKAAISMAVRVCARERAEVDNRIIWALEPGWIRDSEMSTRVLARLEDKAAPHRIPGGRSMTCDEVAEFLMEQVTRGRYWLNGCTVRLDGGEQ